MERPTPKYASPAPRNTTSPALLIIAWLVVALPAAWGISQTVTKSIALFKAPAATPTTTVSK